MMTPPNGFSGLDSLSTGAVLLDAEDHVLYVNPAAEALLGTSDAVLVGEHAARIFERSPELLAAVGATRSTGEITVDHELDVAVGGHPPVRVSSSVSLLEHPPGGVLIEMHAIAPGLRIARLEQVRLQQEANRELLRNLAHEIKNPLGGIRGAAQLLEHELPRAGLREYTQVIIKESDRLQSLTERLLTPHRVPRFHAVNIHEILEHVRSLILAETPGTAVRRDYDVSLPDVHGDAGQLTQAFLNVMRNAVQAMQGAGETVLRTRVARQIVLESRRYRLGMRIEVIDDGPGVPEAIRDQIFYPLVSGREGGSGLGLAVAQTLVAQNGGSIDCESRPGHTVFSIFLPLPG